MLQVRALSPEPFRNQLEPVPPAVQVLLFPQSRRQKLQIAQYSGVFKNIATAQQPRPNPEMAQVRVGPVLAGCPVSQLEPGFTARFSTAEQ